MDAWALGGQWGELDEAVATVTVHAALDAGVNFFDVADGYGPLVAEQRLSAALKGHCQDVLISTKLGNFLPAVTATTPATPTPCT